MQWLITAAKVAVVSQLRSSKRCANRKPISVEMSSLRRGTLRVTTNGKARLPVCHLVTSSFTYGG